MINLPFEICDSHTLDECFLIIQSLEDALKQIKKHKEYIIVFNNITNGVYGYLNNKYGDVNQTLRTFSLYVNNDSINQCKDNLFERYAHAKSKNKKINPNFLFYNSLSIQQLLKDYNKSAELYNEAFKNRQEILLKYLKPENVGYICNKSEYTTTEYSDTITIIFEELSTRQFRTITYSFHNWYVSTCKQIIDFKSYKHRQGWEDYFKNLFPEEYL